MGVKNCYIFKIISTTFITKNVLAKPQSSANHNLRTDDRDLRLFKFKNGVKFSNLCLLNDHGNEVYSVRSDVTTAVNTNLKSYEM